MSPSEETKTSADHTPSKPVPEGPTAYAPMPVLLPLMFLIGFGLIIAYGVVSK